MTTFEEAKRCPKCDNPGEDMGVKKINKDGRRVQIHTIMCKTTLCRWYNTSYLVQVNEDGSIPEAYGQNLKKQFPRLSAESESRVLDALRQQQQVELYGDGEIRNPYA